MSTFLRILSWPFIWLYKWLCGRFRGDPPDIVSPSSGDLEGIAFPVSGTYDASNTITVAVTVTDGSGATVAPTSQNTTASLLDTDWDTGSFSVTFPMGQTSCTCSAKATAAGSSNSVSFTVQAPPPLTLGPPQTQPENDASTTSSPDAPTTHWSVSIGGNSPGTATKATLYNKKARQLNTLTLNNAGGTYTGLFHHVAKGIYRVQVTAIDKTGKTIHTSRKVKVK